MNLKKWSQDVFIAIVMIVFGAFMLINALTKMSADAAMFPILILSVFLALSAALLVKGIKDTKENADAEGARGGMKFSEVKMPLLVYGIIFIYVIAVDKIGFVVSSLIFTAGMLWFNYVRNKLVCVLVPAGLVGFLYVLFTHVLMSRLP